MKFTRELLQDYGESIQNDTTDYIGQVTELVQTTTPTLFESTFKEWLINSVANVFNENKNTNPKCLVICGEQGTCKTYFTSLLFGVVDDTPEDFLTKKRETALALKNDFITRLDGSFLTKPYEVAKLKSLVVKDRVQVREFYHKHVSQHPRITNFIATTNVKSTEVVKARFLVPFDLKAPIDIKAFLEIDINKMWGQAYKLYKQTLNN